MKADCAIYAMEKNIANSPVGPAEERIPHQPACFGDGFGKFVWPSAAADDGKRPACDIFKSHVVSHRNAL
jgi:hypothetical protein